MAISERSRHLGSVLFWTECECWFISGIHRWATFHSIHIDERFADRQILFQLDGSPAAHFAVWDRTFLNKTEWKSWAYSSSTQTPRSSVNGLQCVGPRKRCLLFLKDCLCSSKTVFYDFLEKITFLEKIAEKKNTQHLIYDKKIIFTLGIIHALSLETVFRSFFFFEKYFIFLKNCLLRKRSAPHLRYKRICWLFASYVPCPKKRFFAVFWIIFFF